MAESKDGTTNTAPNASQTGAAASNAASNTAKAAPKPQNQAFKMMGTSNTAHLSHPTITKRTRH